MELIRGKKYRLKKMYQTMFKVGDRVLRYDGPFFGDYHLFTDTVTNTPLVFYSYRIEPVTGTQLLFDFMY